MTATGGDAKRLVEPTVLGAMRRHWLLVSLIVVACVDLALAYGALQQDEYRATATVSAPRPAGSALQSDAQYLDSQVLLLNSRSVGDRALEIARATPGGAGIARQELAPTIGRVEIIPPPSGSSGSYGSTIVSIEFTAPSAVEAQAGVNALATAYDEVRSKEITDNAAARLTAIERAIATAESPSDVAALRKERVQALIDQGRDVAQTASISTAEKPVAPTGSGLLTLLGVGLCLGIVAGSAAAFVRASRLQHVGESQVAHAVYDAPLLYERQGADRSASTVELTEPNRLIGRAVAHRLTALEGRRVIAVVAPPGHPGRSMTAANLALALTEDEAPVLAVDGDDGAMAEWLRPGSPVARPGRAGRSPVPSLLHDSLSVVDLSDPGPTAWDPDLLEAHDGIVVIDCPPMSTSARAVDLLSHCDAVVVLVRADEPVQEHLDVAHWLQLIDTGVLGYVFTPYVRRGPWDWWRGGRARTRVTSDKSTASVPSRNPMLQPTPEAPRQSRPTFPPTGLPAPMSE